MRTKLNLSVVLFIIVLVLYSKPSISQVPFLNNPELELVASGFKFIEGPVWINNTGLLFSDIPENKVYIFNMDSIVQVYLNPSANSNGLALDLQGNLILAQHGSRQIGCLDKNNSVATLVNQFDGKKLNSPNDLIVKSDGSIFFTDPPYGLMDKGLTSELGFCGIYRVSSSGNIELLDKTLTRPNGIAFSPDEKKLYVNDSETRDIYVWDVVNDTTVANKKLFANMAPNGYADGMKTDKFGFLYVAGPTGIWIFDTKGNAIDTIPVPGQTTNCAWGGNDRSFLYVTSGDKLYRIKNKLNEMLIPKNNTKQPKKAALKN